MEDELWCMNSFLDFRQFHCIWISLSDSKCGPELSYHKGTGCGTIIVLVVLAALWAFPLPFGIVIISIPFQTFFVVFALVSIRQEGGSLIPRISKPLKHKIYLILAQSALVFVYTGITFSVTFAKCTPQQQLGLLLLLPLMKIVFKQLIARLASDNTETIPVVVAFTVDLFNGLYVSICLQSSRSWRASFLMGALNVGRAMISVWEIGRQTKELEILNAKSSKIEAFSPVVGAYNIFEANRLQSAILFKATISQTLNVDSNPNSAINALVNASPTLLDLKNSKLKIEENASKLDHSSRKLLYRLEYVLVHRECRPHTLRHLFICRIQPPKR